MVVCLVSGRKPYAKPALTALDYCRGRILSARSDRLCRARQQAQLDTGNGGVFTGEIIVVPCEYLFIDLIAPASQRGAYYGVQTLAVRERR
jgi:hypothetical protein